MIPAYISHTGSEKKERAEDTTPPCLSRGPTGHSSSLLPTLLIPKPHPRPLPHSPIKRTTIQPAPRIRTLRYHIDLLQIHRRQKHPMTLRQ